MTNHALYRDYSEQSFDPDFLEWPSYVLLHAMYGDKMHKPYVAAAEKKWRPLVIKDHSAKFYQLRPEATRYVTEDADTTNEEDTEDERDKDKKTLEPDNGAGTKRGATLHIDSPASPVG